VIDVVGKVYEHTKKQIKNYPCRVNRASSLGGDCVRALVYDRLNWQDKAPIEVGLQRIFNEGYVQEDAIMIELAKAGVVVIEQQATMEWKEYEISGHLDGIILDGDKQYPFDAKSMSPFIWDSICFRGAGVYEWEEVKERFEKKPWLRKYLPQLVLYMLMKNLDKGFLLLKNKTSGALAQVNIELDYEVGESLLKKAEEINKHVKAETYPDRIVFDKDVCPRCPHALTCCPDKIGEPLKFVEDETVEGWLDTIEQSADVRKEYVDADKDLKTWAKAQDEDKLSVGDWLVTKTTASNGAVRVKTERIPQIEGSSAEE